MRATLLRRIEADPGVLAKRTLTGAVLALTVAGAIWFGPRPAPAVVIALLVLVGAWEWAGLAAARRPATAWRRGAYVLVVAAVMALSWILAGASGRRLLVVWSLAMAWWLGAAVLLWRQAAPVGGQDVDASHTGARLAGTLDGRLVLAAGLFSLVPAWLAFGQIHLRTSGGWALLSLVLLTVAADVGAYFAGRLFGRRQLVPRVSPGKTVEGMIGGLLAAFAASALLLLSPLALPARAGLPLAAVVLALSAVLGDLTVSLFKRNAGLKHSGRLLPGHGGVLDRIDSFCVTAPVWALWLALVTEFP